MSILLDRATKIIWGEAFDGPFHEDDREVCEEQARGVLSVVLAHFDTLAESGSSAYDAAIIELEKALKW